MSFWSECQIQCEIFTRVFNTNRHRCTKYKLTYIKSLMCVHQAMAQFLCLSFLQSMSCFLSHPLSHTQTCTWTNTQLPWKIVSMKQSTIVRHWLPFTKPAHKCSVKGEMAWIDTRREGGKWKSAGTRKRKGEQKRLIDGSDVALKMI